MSSRLLWAPVALVAVTLLGACDRSPVAPGAEPVASQHDATSYAEWSAPVNLGETVNSDQVEIEATVSKDGLSLYFSSNRDGGYGGFDIWVARRASLADAWGEPENLGETINTGRNEQGPHLTTDGHRLFFFSNRDGGVGGNDVYVTRRHDKRDDFGWGPPGNVGTGVNSTKNDNLPVYVADDRGGAGTLYFNSNRPGGLGGTDIYASTEQPDGTFGPAVGVVELNSAVQDAGLAIRRDGLEAILASTREGTLGGFDLWVATRARITDAWSTPVNLGTGVNTASDESRLALSFDGTTLYVISDRAGTYGNLDIWASTRAKRTGPPQ